MNLLETLTEGFNKIVEPIIVLEGGQLVYKNNISDGQVETYQNLNEEKVLDFKFYIESIVYDVKVFTDSSIGSINELLNYLNLNNWIDLSNSELTISEIYDEESGKVHLNCSQSEWIQNCCLLKCICIKYGDKALIYGIPVEQKSKYYKEIFLNYISSRYPECDEKNIYIVRLTVISDSEIRRLHYKESLVKYFNEDFVQMKLNIELITLGKNIYFVTSEPWFKLTAYFSSDYNPVYELYNEQKNDFKWRLVVSKQSLLSITQLDMLDELEGLYGDGEYNKVKLARYISKYKRERTMQIMFTSHLDTDRLNLFAHEIINISEKRIVGIEFYLRYDHPEYGNMKAGDFIKIASESDAIVRMDAWVIDRVVQLMQSEHDFLRDKKCHINLSHKSIISSIIMNKLLSIDEHTASQIVLEVKDVNRGFSFRALTKLKKKKFILSTDLMDDNLLSISSEKYQLFQIVKMKKLLKNDLDNKRFIYKKTIDSIISNKIDIIVEGIENRDLLEFNVSLGVKSFQGHYFSIPEAINIQFKVWQSLDYPNQLSEQINGIIESGYIDNENIIFIQSLKESGKIKIPNLDLARYLGYSYEYYKDINFYDLLKEETVPEFKYFLENAGRDHAVIMTIRDNRYKFRDVLVRKTLINNDEVLLIEVPDNESSMNILTLSEQYSNMFEYSSEALLIITPDFIIRHANVAFKEIFRIVNTDNINLFALLENRISSSRLKKMFSESKINGFSEEKFNLYYEGMDEKIIKWHVRSYLNMRTHSIEYLCRIADTTKDVKTLSEYKKIRSALDQSKSFIIMTDVLGIIEYVNMNFIQAIGYEESIIGKSVYKLDALKYMEGMFSELWQYLNVGEIWEGEVISTRLDGSQFWCSLVIYPIKEEGSIIGFVYIFEDLSQQRNLEISNTDLKNKLFEQDKVASLGMITTGLMHEINNPISFVFGNIQYIQESFQDYENLDAEDKDDMLDAINDVSKGILQIKTIADGLKKYIFKGQNEHFEVNIIDEINTVLVIAKNEYKYYANINIIYDMDKNYSIKGNGSNIKQVFMNLIINASHAIASKKEDELGEINIQLERGENDVLIQVTDDGCGMSDEVMESIFEPLFTTKEEGLGSGLGLSVTKKIIEEHGGRIEVNSTIGKGTTFSIWLPTFSEE